MSNSSIWPKDGSLSGVTTPGQSEPASDGNKKLLRLPQISSITDALPLLFSVISKTLVGGVLPLCRDVVGIFYSTSRLGEFNHQCLNNTTTVIPQGLLGHWITLESWYVIKETKPN